MFHTESYVHALPRPHLCKTIPWAKSTSKDLSFRFCAFQHHRQAERSPVPSRPWLFTPARASGLFAGSSPPRPSSPNSLREPSSCCGRGAKRTPTCAAPVGQRLRAILRDLWVVETSAFVQNPYRVPPVAV